MYKASLSYEGMSDKEIFFNDYKEYKIGGKQLSVACLNAYDEESVKKLAERMKTTMHSMLQSTGMDMSFVLISILHVDISVTYFIPSDDEANEMIKAAFGDKVVSDGVSYRIEPYASRKKVFIPAITTVLESFPKE